MDYGYDEIPSFNDTVAKYDDTFFEKNSLILVYVGTNSGTYRFGVNRVYCDGNSFCIHVEQANNPETVTEDMAGWFVTVAVPGSMVENCTEFDADLNHNFNQSHTETSKAPPERMEPYFPLMNQSTLRLANRAGAANQGTDGGDRSQEELIADLEAWEATQKEGHPDFKDNSKHGFDP